MTFLFDRAELAIAGLEFSVDVGLVWVLQPVNPMLTSNPHSPIWLSFNAIELLSNTGLPIMMAFHNFLIILSVPQDK
jgi:hypothetical protein